MVALEAIRINEGWNKEAEGGNIRRRERSAAAPVIPILNGLGE
jgi:hypothetical protein